MLPLGSCSGANDDGDEEDWAAAVAVVAANKSWTPGAVRMIVPVSDEGPRCGYLNYNDPTSDTDDCAAVQWAIEAIKRGTGVIVVPIVDDTVFTSREAHNLSNGGAKLGEVLRFTEVDLAGKIAQVARRNCPKDCNGDWKIDGCQIDDGILLDNVAFTSNCCGVHATPGCDNPTVAACVCNPDLGALPNCCSVAWNNDCVEAAIGLNCLANCPVGSDRIPDRCQPSPDCQLPGEPGYGIGDACDVDPGDYGCGISQDCNNNGVPDECDVRRGVSSDCNGNGVLDACDIHDAASCDRDQNNVPDECFACCDGSSSVCRNLAPTLCAAAGGTSFPELTCRGEELPYAPPGMCTCAIVACCDACCGENCSLPGQPGCCSEVPECSCIAAGGQAAVPPSNQSCSLGVDPCTTGSCCNPSTGCRDYARVDGQLTRVTPALCNGQGEEYVGGRRCKGGTCSGAPEISCSSNSHCRVGEICIPNSGSDLNQPPTCDAASPNPLTLLTPATCHVAEPKNRYISFIPLLTCGSTAIRVKLTSLHHPNPPYTACEPPESPCPPPGFSAYEGQVRYVVPIRDALGNVVASCPDSALFGSSFRCAKLALAPEYRSWGTELDGKVLHVTGSEVIPSSTYTIDVLLDSCQGNEASCAHVSSSLVVTTSRWGDVEVPFQVPSPANLTEPNVLDIAAIVNKIKDLPAGTNIKPRMQLRDSMPDPRANVNVLDVAYLVDTVKSGEKRFYPFRPCPDPSPVPCGMACTTNRDCPDPALNPCIQGVCLDECRRCCQSQECS